LPATAGSKATYCKRDKTDRRRAKDNVRYIMHRRDREGNKVTRDLFGFDGFVSKDTAYRMILSPDPRHEDRYKDLDLRTLTRATMLQLEQEIRRGGSPHKNRHRISLGR
jgi:hypothetical protein